jgi:hypothetical protein
MEAQESYESFLSTLANDWAPPELDVHLNWENLLSSCSQTSPNTKIVTENITDSEFESAQTSPLPQEISTIQDVSSDSLDQLYRLLSPPAQLQHFKRYSTK